MSKRSNGEGTIYKRADGKWCASKYIEMPDGTYKRKYIYGKTQKAVKERLNEFEQAQNFTEEAEMLFQDWVLQWVVKYKKSTLKRTTYESYLANINKHIVGDIIGRTKLLNLTTGLLQTYYNRKLSGTKETKPLSRRTVEYLRTIIGSSLKQAYKNDLVVKNANDATVLPKKERHEIEPLTISELNQVLAAAKGTKMYPLIVTEIYTGMRRGDDDGKISLNQQKPSE